jgi:anti-anti-sigma regulatory factor
MVFKENKYGDITVISVNCATTVSIHANNFKDYLSTVLSEKSNKVIVDLREAVYVDSSFIGALVLCFKSIKDSDKQIKLVCGNTHGHFWSFFQVTKVFSEMSSFSNLNEALKAFDTELEKVA